MSLIDDLLDFFRGEHISQRKTLAKHHQILAWQRKCGRKWAERELLDGLSTDQFLAIIKQRHAKDDYEEAFLDAAKEFAEAVERDIKWRNQA